MTVSGWGAANPQAGYNDKQPWRFAEPYLSVNREYLEPKMRLTPHFSTLARNATDTGVPTVRAMALEFENDPTAYTRRLRPILRASLWWLQVFR